jgi:nitrous oxide reductase accessory protein NosL
LPVDLAGDQSGPRAEGHLRAGQQQPEAVKPLISVDQATYLIGGKAPGVMTQRSKVSFGSKEAAMAAKEQDRRRDRRFRGGADRQLCRSGARTR